MLSVVGPVDSAAADRRAGRHILQIGFEIHAEPLAPKLSKLNPLTGLKRILSLRGLVELGKSLAKIVFIAAIAWGVVSGYLTEFPTLMRRDIGGIWEIKHTAAFGIIHYVCLDMIVLAVLDYAYQRWQHEQSLKMTKQEVKDERKQTEGDPQIKARIRSLQRQAAYHRMMAEVPKADVVITNPTHLAVAVRFDPTEMAAPRVVAKGADHIAQRIRDVADKTFAINVADHEFRLDAPLEIACNDLVRFEVTSDDLTYGFGLFREDESMLFQMQVVPGHMYDVLWEFTKNGTYSIRSTEYSGPKGYQMVVKDAVRVTGCTAEA